MSQAKEDAKHHHCAAIQQMYREEFGIATLAVPVFYISRKYLRKTGVIENLPISECLGDTPFNVDLVAIAVESWNGTNPPDVWGLHRITPLLITCNLSTMTIASIEECNCFPVGAMQLQGRMLPFEVLQKTAERMPVNLDELQREVNARLAQYKTPTDDGMAALTTRSFLICCAAVHYAPPHRKAHVYTKFLRNEMLLIKYRLGRCNLRDNTSQREFFQTDTCSQAGVMLLTLLNSPHGSLFVRLCGAGQIMCTSMALWCWVALERLKQELHDATLVPRTALINHEGVRGIINAYTDELYKMHLIAPTAAAQRQARRIASPTFISAGTVSAVADMEDLATMMPACMRSMRQKMAHPSPADHYKRDKRRLFHNFALGTGLRSEQYMQFVLDANQHTNDAYKRKLAVEVSRDAKDLADEPKDLTGCKCAPCPYLKTSHPGFQEYKQARITCHSDFNARAGFARDPEPGWFQSPLHFTQRLIKIRQDRKAAEHASRHLAAKGAAVVAAAAAASSASASASSAFALSSAHGRLACGCRESDMCNCASVQTLLSSYASNVPLGVPRTAHLHPHHKATTLLALKRKSTM